MIEAQTQKLAAAITNGFDPFGLTGDAMNLDVDWVLIVEHQLFDDDFGREIAIIHFTAGGMVIDLQPTGDLRQIERLTGFPVDELATGMRGLDAAAGRVGKATNLLGGGQDGDGWHDMAFAENLGHMRFH